MSDDAPSIWPHEPRAWQWDFERVPYPGQLSFRTMSVGVFQWLPKAGGGAGLKKSKTIRVKGYCLEPDRVYAKAREVCDRLNQEEVRWDAPPDWVQREYSVPKPEGLVTEITPEQYRELGLRPPDPIVKASTFRGIRQRAGKELLEPAGFVRNGPTYIRVADGQVFGIDFQASKYGREFTVNLCFSYDFFLSASSIKPLAFPKFSYLDFWLHARLEGVLARHKWWPYGKTPEQARKTLGSVIKASLAEINERAALWSDPHWFLKHCSPNKVKRCRWFPEPLGEWVSLQTFKWGLCAIALELGERRIAQQYADLMESAFHQKDEASAAFFRRQWQPLLARLRK